MNEYYNRCHLTHNWENFLLRNKVSMGEYVEGRQTANSAEQVVKGGSTEASPSEAGSEHPEPHCEALLAVLSAHGILKPLLSPLWCPACNDYMAKEASYKCLGCDVTYHVRCLHTVDFDLPLEQGGVRRQPVFGPYCVTCDYKREMVGFPLS